MNVIEFGKENSNVILLLHGGGLNWWNYREAARLLSSRFHVVLPILNGHAGSDAPFTSMEAQADDLIGYVDSHFHGQVLLMGGLSLGGQVLLEILSRRKDICRYAILESASVLPMKCTARWIRPAVSMSHPWIKQQWFSRLQFRSLRLPPDFFDLYFKDTSVIKKEDLTAMLEANSLYSLKSSLVDCRAKALVLAGKKEQPRIKRSAAWIANSLPHSQILLMPGLHHGELSIQHAGQYVQLLENLLDNP